MNKMPRCVVPSATICDELLDNGAEIMCSNMSLNIQIEGKISAHDSTSIDASSLFFEVKDDYSATSIAVPIPLQKTMNDDTYSYDAPQDVEEIVHQNPCENESHIAKLIVSENKSEMCDSTISEVEIINKRIHHTKRQSFIAKHMMMFSLTH
jgi:hypothetical protein